MRMLLGLARPDSGQALIDGQRYEELADPRLTVGAALDSMGFHPGRSGRNHLRVVACAAGIPAARVNETLAVVGLTEAADRRAGGYSRGMQQRLALAGALLGNPRVLILDEPNIGLDPAGIAWLRETMRGWAADGRTVLVSSHVLTEVALVADRVVIIDKGRVLQESDASELGGAEPAVLVRTPDIDKMEEICLTQGWGAERAGLDRLTIMGATTEQIGLTAAAAAVVIYELKAEAVMAQLEQTFLELTGTNREVPS
jgi:ABC-2 type transport system ATP-binding protein